MTDINLSQLEAIPNQLGYLVLNEEGALIYSHGELENDSATAKVISRMVKIAWNVKMDNSMSSTQSLSLNFANFVFVVTVSNNKILVVKKQTTTKEQIEKLIDV